MTLAQQFKNEGKREGILEGKREGILEGKREGILEGKREGILEGKKENTLDIAKNLLKYGVSLDLVKKSTGLSQKQIEDLIKNNYDISTTI